ncbi:MAG: Ig domain-containing protein, partial [Myxococcota bacterium]
GMQAELDRLNEQLKTPTPALARAQIAWEQTMRLEPGQWTTLVPKTLAATGGVVPYAWSVAAGSLPPGLALNAATGTISGTPTAAGNWSFTARVTDARSPAVSATRTFTLKVKK